VQQLVNERIQTIVRAKGESVLLSVYIDTALEEESAILSVKERGFTSQKFNKGPEIANTTTGNRGSMIKESSRGFEFVKRDVNRGLTRRGRGTGVDVSKGTGTNTHVLTRATDMRIICHACGERGHIKRMCSKNSSGTWRWV
jgi:hypothetical protein